MIESSPLRANLESFQTKMTSKGFTLFLAALIMALKAGRLADLPEGRRGQHPKRILSAVCSSMPALWAEGVVRAMAHVRLTQARRHSPQPCLDEAGSLA